MLCWSGRAGSGHGQLQPTLIVIVDVLRNSYGIIFIIARNYHTFFICALPSYMDSYSLKLASEPVIINRTRHAQGVLA